MSSVDCFPFLCLFSRHFRHNKVRKESHRTIRNLFQHLSRCDIETVSKVTELINSGALLPFYGKVITFPDVECQQTNNNLIQNDANHDNLNSSLASMPSAPISMDNNSIFSASQLFLIQKMDAVINWNKYLNESEILEDNDLPTLTATKDNRTIRIASWNLNRFNLNKSRHPGFLEVVCTMIIRSRFSIILLQEISDPKVGEIICEELNNPSLPHVIFWYNKRFSSLLPCWKFTHSIQPTGSMFRSKEYALFLYNSTMNIKLTKTTLLEKDLSNQNKVFSRSPCAVLCQLHQANIIIISVHLKAAGLRNSQVNRTISEVENLGILVKAFYDTQPAGTHLIIAGDFNLGSSHEAYHVLHKCGLWAIFDNQNPKLVQNHKSSSRLNLYDNAWLSNEMALTEPHLPRWTGDSGVITSGLKHPLISDELAAGANGSVSDHSPIWFDIYTS